MHALDFLPMTSVIVQTAARGLWALKPGVRWMLLFLVLAAFGGPWVWRTLSPGDAVGTPTTWTAVYRQGGAARILPGRADQRRP